MRSKEEVLEVVKKSYNNNHLALPGGIAISEENDVCTLVLKSESIKKRNMQQDDNAFEGWSIAIYKSFVSQGIKHIKIKIDVDGPLDIDDFVGENKGHQGRFLYRILRFREQYKWFCLSDYLDGVVKKFETFLSNNKGNLKNNIGEGDAGDKENAFSENGVESALSEKGALREIVKDTFDIGENAVYRQLAVGLFLNEVETPNSIFTGKKSAIDLWTWNEKTFEVIELKYEQSKMAIVTEIFFYTNYLRDLVTADGMFTLNKDYNEKDDRGYKNIVDGTFDNIVGMLLAYKYHSLIDDEFIKILNENGDINISYYKVKYDKNDIKIG